MLFFSCYSFCLEIHQIDPNRYFGKAPFLLDPLDLGSQHFAGVQQAGKDDVVLLGDISEFLFVCREDEDRIAVEFVVLAKEGELVADFDLLQGCRRSLIACCSIARTSSPVWLVVSSFAIRSGHLLSEGSSL